MGEQTDDGHRHKSQGNLFSGNFIDFSQVYHNKRVIGTLNDVHLYRIVKTLFVTRDMRRRKNGIYVLGSSGCRLGGFG